MNHKQPKRSLDMVMLSNDGLVADALTVSLSSSVAAGGLTIDPTGAGDSSSSSRSVMLEIGSDSGTFLVLAEDPVLCGDAMCKDRDLVDNLPPYGYAYTRLGTGIAYDLNTGELTNTTRAFNVSCADGFMPGGAGVEGEAGFVVVRCEERRSFADFDANASLQCVPVPGDWCSASIWAGDGSGSSTAKWDGEDSWIGGLPPTSNDIAVLLAASDGGDVTATLDSSTGGQAKGLTIDGGDSAVMLEIGGSGTATMLVLAESQLPMCGNYLCRGEDLAVPEGYIATGLGSGISYDIETGVCVRHPCRHRRRPPPVRRRRGLRCPRSERRAVEKAPSLCRFAAELVLSLTDFLTDSLTPPTR
jgi:hypothetical protein